MFETAVDGRFGISDDFQIGADSFQDQSHVRFAALPGGGFVAVWTGEDGFNDYGVHAQIYDNNGQAISADFVVNSATNGVESDPAVATLPSGGFIVTWSDESSGSFDIHGQIFDAQGHRVGAELTANSTTAGFQVDSEVTALAGGGFVVTWKNPNDSSFDDIHAQVFSADGTKIGAEIVANDSKPGDKDSPTITALAGGGFVVGWFQSGAEVEDQYGNLSPGTRAQIFDASGNKVGDAFSLNSFVAGTQQDPTLASLPSGGFVAAYADNGVDGINATGHAGIWIQLFDASGNKVGSEVHASGDGDVNDLMPVIEVVPGTGFMVAWRDGSGSTVYDIHAQMFDFSGNKIGDEFELDSTTTQSQNVPDLAYLSNGSLVVGWNDQEAPSYNDLDVRARLLVPIVHGTEGSDTFFGTAIRDFYMGNGGNDVIHGGAGNDGLSGGDGNDIVDGGAGADILTGGAGTDTLTGGDGDDQFTDTAAGLNGDTITDFNLGDSIVIEDADLNSFNFSLSGNVLTYTGGSLTFGSDIVGTIVASTGPHGGVQLSISQHGSMGTIDQIADQLINGFWDWMGEGAHHFNVTKGGTITVDIHTLTAAEQTLARAAFAEWHDIIGVNFNEVITGSQILITDEEDPTAGGQPSAYTEDTSSGGITTSAHVHISKSWITTYGVALVGGGQSLDSYAFQTYLHEIGHALGLGHSGNYNFNADYAHDAIFTNDSWATSVMSYFSQTDNFYTANQGFTQDYALTPMPADIVALQEMYGLSTTTRTGNTTYGFNSNAGSNVYNPTIYPDAAYTIFDNGGSDTIDYSGSGADQLINLNPETFSNVNGYTGNLSIGRGVVIENAIGGSGDDMLIGNNAANVLTGNGGNDTLDGGTGADTMIGGAGDDTYVVERTTDVVTENANEGTDLVQSSVSYTLGANLENLTLTGSLSIGGTGNSLANVITGNGGSNVINGGGGADTMAGGAGNDTYYVDNVSDAVTENASAGTDLVISTISYALGANLENLTLSGPAANGTGNELANTIRGTNSANMLDGGNGNDLLMGNGGNDTLVGGSGNDKLNGGAGTDAMSGGIGDDSYYVDTASDIVTENAGEGTADKVISTIDYTLGANIERLMLYGSAAINGTGNELANVMYGNEAANVIDGGAGADTLFGHGGNDTLIGGAGRDTMVGGAGNDTFLFHNGDFGGATTSTADRITDFTSGQDKIDLSAVDANSLLGGDQGFSFVGTSAFSHTAGELRYEQINGSTYVEGDTNGDGIADFMIKLDGLHSVMASDFLT